MAVMMITGEALYRMHRLKREIEEGKSRRSKWPYLAAAFLVFWLLIGR
jgi:hypothetical protein